MFILLRLRTYRLWLIFMGLVTVPLLFSCLVWQATPGGRCAGTTGIPGTSWSIGTGPFVTWWRDACPGRAVLVWHWGEIASWGGTIFLSASVITAFLGNRQTGVSRSQQWVTTVMLVGTLGGLMLFATGFGQAIDCHSPDGLCAFPIYLISFPGFIIAFLGSFMNVFVDDTVPRIWSLMGLLSVPLMILLWVTIAILN